MLSDVFGPALKNAEKLPGLPKFKQLFENKVCSSLVSQVALRVYFTMGTVVIEFAYRNDNNDTPLQRSTTELQLS